MVHAPMKPTKRDIFCEIVEANKKLDTILEILDTTSDFTKEDEAVRATASKVSDAINKIKGEK